MSPLLTTIPRSIMQGAGTILGLKWELEVIELRVDKNEHSKLDGRSCRSGAPTVPIRNRNITEGYGEATVEVGHPARGNTQFIDRIRKPLGTHRRGLAQLVNLFQPQGQALRTATRVLGLRISGIPLN